MFVWKSQYHTDVSSFKNELQYNALIRKFQTEFNGIYEAEFEYSKSGKNDWYNCEENMSWESLLYYNGDIKEEKPLKVCDIAYA